MSAARASKRRKGESGAAIAVDVLIPSASSAVSPPPTATSESRRKRKRSSSVDEPIAPIVADYASCVDGIGSALARYLASARTARSVMAPVPLAHASLEAMQDSLTVAGMRARVALVGPDELLKRVDEVEDSFVEANAAGDASTTAAGAKARAKRRTANQGLSERLLNAHVDKRQDAPRALTARFRVGDFTLDTLQDCRPAFTLYLFADTYAINDATARRAYTPSAMAFLAAADLQLIQPDFIRSLEAQIPLHYQSGCLVVELRDHRHPVAAPSSAAPCRVRKILLRPSAASLQADLDRLQKEDWGDSWTPDDRIAVEKAVIRLVQPPLCLDPSPFVFQLASHLSYEQRKLCLPFDPAAAEAVHAYCLANVGPRTVASATAVSLPLVQFLNEQQRHGRAPNSQQVDPLAAAPWRRFEDSPVGMDLSVTLPSAHRPLHRRPTSRKLARTVKFSPTRRQGMSAFCVLDIYRLDSGLYDGVLRLGVGEDSGSNGSVIEYPLGTGEQTARYIDQFKRLYYKEGNMCVFDTDDGKREPASAAAGAGSAGGV